MRYRLASPSPEHAQEISSLEALLYPPPLRGADSWRLDLERPYSNYCALWEGERLIACASSWNLLQELEVTQVLVHPRYQGQGWGKFIFAKLLESGIQGGVERATLAVRRDNEPALKVYRRFGFTQVGIRPKYYQGRYDALLMVCEDLQDPAYRQNLEHFLEEYAERISK